MKKMCLALIILLNSGFSVLGMQKDSWVFQGLSPEDLALFNADMENGAVRVELIKMFNEIEEKRIDRPHDFSVQDRAQLTEIKGCINYIDVLMDQAKKSDQEKYDLLKTLSNKKKAALNLMDRFSSSSSSSEEERRDWVFVNFTPQDINELGSCSEEESSSEEGCNLTGNDKLRMVAWSLVFFKQ